MVGVRYTVRLMTFAYIIELYLLKKYNSFMQVGCETDPIRVDDTLSDGAGRCESWGK